MKNYNYIWIRAILFAVILIFSIHITSAQNSRTYNYKFDPTNFELTTSSDGTTAVKSTKHRLTLLEDTLKPAIPYVTANILIPNGAELSDVKYNIASSCKLGNYTLANNPKTCINNGRFESVKTDSRTRATGVLPNSQIDNYCLNIMDGYRIVSVRFSPFTYNIENKELSLITDIDITVKTTTTTEADAKKGNVMRKIVANFVDNPHELDALYNKRISETQMMRYSFPNDKVDYLIITVDSLTDYFKELQDWSIRKGLMTKVVSVEDLYGDATDYNVKSYRIKQQIYTRYRNSGLKSVLLAGDYDMVPTKFCFCQVMDTITNDLPTDLFYACFDNTFNWNANNNNLYGEENDNIDMSPDIFISRLPVRNSVHISNYTDKLLRYEKNAENMNIYANKILFAGSKLFYGGNGVNSDTHNRGNYLYENFVQPDSSAPYNYLYDTGSSYGDEYVFSAPEIQTVLSEGFNIVHIDAHGDFDRWKVGGYTSRTEYTTEHASSLNSPNLACIISSSCLVNNFTADTECLGEAFIRSATSGNIAFIGNTDYGVSTNLYNGSLDADTLFFSKLYKDGMRVLGEIVTAIKMNITFGSSVQGINRWVAFALNSLGDPNLQLNLAGYDEFDNVEIKFSENEGIEVNTGVDSSAIILLCTEENDITVINKEDNVMEHLFDAYSGSYIISITNEGYHAFASDENPIKLLSVQATNFFLDNKFVVKNALIGSNVIPDYISESVLISPGGSLTVENTGAVTITKDFECKKGGTLTITPKQ